MPRTSFKEQGNLEAPGAFTSAEGNCGVSLDICPSQGEFTTCSNHSQDNGWCTCVCTYLCIDLHCARKFNTGKTLKTKVNQRHACGVGVCCVVLSGEKIQQHGKQWRNCQKARHGHPWTPKTSENEHLRRRSAFAVFSSFDNVFRHGVLIQTS